MYWYLLAVINKRRSLRQALRVLNVGVLARGSKLHGVAGFKDLSLSGDDDGHFTFFNDEIFDGSWAVALGFVASFLIEFEGEEFHSAVEALVAQEIAGEAFVLGLLSLTVLDASFVIDSGLLGLANHVGHVNF